MRNSVLMLTLAAVVAPSLKPAGAATNFTYLGGYSQLGSMLGVSGLDAGDLDGDGKKEIVVTGTTLEFGGPGIFTVLRADATATDGYRQLAFSSSYDVGLSALSAVKAGDYPLNLDLPVMVRVQERAKQRGGGRRDPFTDFFGEDSPFGDSFFDNFFGGMTEKPLTLQPPPPAAGSQRSNHGGAWT